MIRTWQERPSAAAFTRSRSCTLPFTQWDIGTVVSERYSSVGGPLGIVKDTTNYPLGNRCPAEHVDTMINKGCYNPTPKAGTRWSMYSYNWNSPRTSPSRAAPSGPVTSFVYSRAVTYLGNLLLSLHTELGAAQKKLACGNVDALGNTGRPGGHPIAVTTCTVLDGLWTTAQSNYDELRPVAGFATSYPSCLRHVLHGVQRLTSPSGRSGSGRGWPADTDPANRAGELWSRTDVIKHVFVDHFQKAWALGLGRQRP